MTKEYQLTAVEAAKDAFAPSVRSKCRSPTSPSAARADHVGDPRPKRSLTADMVVVDWFVIDERGHGPVHVVMHAAEARLQDRKDPAMIDPFGRAITYLRVSVTDRCDLRCVYC